MIPEIRETTIALPQNQTVKSLSFYGDTLVDWASGGTIYHFDGAVEESHWAPGYDRLDAAVVSPSGRYVVIYERLGTKGIVLETQVPPNGAHLGEQPQRFRIPRIVREINRSFNCADDYEYPVVLFQRPGGREVLAHCPSEYHILTIEDTETGEALASYGEIEKTESYFFSCLAVNPSGKRLLSAGWYWQPSSALIVLDVDALFTGQPLPDIFPLMEQYETRGEMSSAAFLDDDRIVVSSTDYYDFDKCAPWLLRQGVALYDLAAQRGLASVSLDEQAGTIMPLNEQYVISFYRHPKVIDLRTGVVIYRWPQWDSGTQILCITRKPIPVLALDSAHRRFALKTENAIQVVELG